MQVVEGLAAKASPRFAYDSYRRLLDMYGDVVMGETQAQHPTVASRVCSANARRLRLCNAHR